MTQKYKPPSIKDKFIDGMTEGYTDMAGISHGWIWRANHVKCNSLAKLLSVGGVPPQTDKAGTRVKELFQGDKEVGLWR